MKENFKQVNKWFLVGCGIVILAVIVMVILVLFNGGNKNKQLVVDIANGSTRVTFKPDLPTDAFDRWMHLTVVFDRINHKILVSYDFGEFLSMDIPEALWTTSIDVSGNNLLNIGQDGFGSYYSKIEASVDDFMIFDGVLDSTDLEGLKQYYDELKSEVIDIPGIENNLWATFDGSASDEKSIHTMNEHQTVSYVDGKYNKAADLSAGYVSVDGVSLGTDSFTVATWLNSNVTSGDPVLCANKAWKGSGVGLKTGFLVSVNKAGYIQVNMADGSTRIDHKVNMPEGYLGSWIHVIITVDRTNNLVSVRYNFGEATTMEIPEALRSVNLDTSMPFNIGNDGNGAYSAIKASVDDFLMFNGAMDDAGVAALKAYYDAKDGIRYNYIRGAQVMMGESLAIVYKAVLEDSNKAAQMKFTMDGKEILVSGTATSEEGVYNFVYDGIAPQRMGDIVKAELVFGETILDTKEEYSVKLHCDEMLEMISNKSIDGYTDTQYAALKTLIVDMLAYGAAAQVYTDYNKDELVNSGVTDSPTEYVPTVAEPIIGESKSDTVNVTHLGMYFDFTNMLYIRLSAIDGVSVIVKNGEDELVHYETLDSAIVYSPEMTATSFDTVLTFEIYENGSLVQEVEYSVAAYVYSIKESANIAMADLAKALYNYGKSATAYAMAIEA